VTVEPAIWVTGASGLVGRELARRVPIVALSREAESVPGWDPLGGEVRDDGRPLRALVHLAGENVAAGRWTRARRDRISQSRLRGTRTLVDWLERRAQRPDVLVAASAVGYYGDRGDEALPEHAPPGSGFLADVCRRWEEESSRAEALGIRVVQLRLGLVLARGDGVLGRLEPIFRLGAGGPVGSGRQWFPWVHADDVVRGLEWAIEQPEARGAYNLVAPGIVRQREFARALGRALHRPALLPTPAFALRAAFGALADEALLASQRAQPERLERAGFTFRFAELPRALDDLFG
jgi:uncharacterized protein (TIGR01777 family)